MKFDIGLWIFKIAARLGLLKKLMKPVSSVPTRDLEALMRRVIGGLSDDEIDKYPEKAGEWDWTKEPFATMANQLKDTGISIDTITQWVSDEKFLRDHRRKYHPDRGGGK